MNCQPAPRQAVVDGPSFTVEVSRSLHDPRWDDFLARCPSGHHEQTSLWAQVKANYGWSPIRHVIFENGGICGGFQILCKSLHHFGRIGYISHGPAIGREDEALKRYVALQIDRAARKERLAYLVVVPGYPDQNVAAQLKKVGFKDKPNWLPPTGLMQATFLVDLRDDLHVIRGRMHRKARKNIRYGLKTGLIVREGRDEKTSTLSEVSWRHCAAAKGLPRRLRNRIFFSTFGGYFLDMGFSTFF